MIQIIAIGKKHESWIAEGLGRYQKRLKRPYMVEWILLPHSTYDGVRARQEESERILTRISPDHFVLLLDETGQQYDSPTVARKLEMLHADGKKIVILIGGAYGVNEALKRRADFVWSLSPLVFPHQLVRLMLVEQLYRAQTIVSGHSYHHS